MCTSEDGCKVFAFCFCLVLILIPVAIFFILVAAGLIGFKPVTVAVDESVLRHLALPGGGVETVSYKLSLAVAVRNLNWAIAVWRTAPLVAELRFCGQRLGRAALAAGGERERIGATKKKVYRVARRLGRTMSCPLKLRLSTPTSGAAFRRVKCTKACTDD